MNTAPSHSSCPRRPMTRRHWIQRLAMATAACASPGARLLETTVRGATALPGTLMLDVSAFASLGLNNGSAIVTFDGGTTQLLINRESEVDYTVLDPHCTHMGCIVEPYSIATNTIFCPCHSSQYDIHGHVVHGPAVSNLFTYPARFDGISTLSIDVPGFVHRLDEVAAQPQSTAGRRLRLTFPTLPGAEYQIRSAPTLTEPFNVTGFALTPAGVANQSALYGTGGSASVYVEASGDSWFYRLELVIHQLA